MLIIYDVTRLQHLEQMRQDFVANVSHELRTPLTVLMGYLETFSDQPDISPQWRRGMMLMTQQTARMNSIVNDLLLLSRLENEEKPTLSCIDMNRLLTQVFDDASIYNKEYEHHISLQVDTDSNLYGAELYLNSALLNLVVNAIKYTPKGGNIVVSWTETEKGCVFAVTDDGIGIAPQHIARLTERFYRVDSGRSRATGGTGLGLAIVKHVLYQHQATLHIESEEGQGSTFSILFAPASICAPDPNLSATLLGNDDTKNSETP
jgi:two-component system phosphate regulon sensor histidine kinase PhoR